MDQTAFFQAGDDVNLPAGRSADPIEKSATVTCVAQGAGCDYPNAVGALRQSGAMKSAQHSQSVGHRMRIKYSVGENALAQAGHFAVFVESFKTTVYNPRYFQPDRVRTNVNRSECGHAEMDIKVSVTQASFTSA
jgi:hypothetical protein